MGKQGKKKYVSGDQMHFLVVGDFVSIANEFVDHCKENAINSSGAIRMAMKQWLDLQKSKEDKLLQFEEQTLRTDIVIEDAFLIYQDGALLAHVTSRIIPDLDMDLFTGMLTAIQSFVKESFTDLRDFRLKQLDFGNNKIYIERGELDIISLAIVYSGEGGIKLLNLLAKEIIHEIEMQFGDVLVEWDGNLNKVRGCREIIMDHLIKTKEFLS